MSKPRHAMSLSYIQSIKREWSTNELIDLIDGRIQKALREKEELDVRHTDTNCST
jgi:hypothetical protein